MKKLVLALVFIALFVTPSVASAQIPGVEFGHYTDSDFYWVEEYPMSWGDGPACYYQQPVSIVYTATTQWTYVLRQGTVAETLTQVGTATVYDANGNVIDERPLHVQEHFVDRGVDVAVRHDSGETVWYEASHDWYNADLEAYVYNWQIDGVFDVYATNSNGKWAFAWHSGECGGAWDNQGRSITLPFSLPDVVPVYSLD